MDAMNLILCLGIVVILALAGIVILLLNSSDKKDAQPASDKPMNKRTQEWRSWIPFFVIAVVLAFWTIWGALFLLAVVWLMRQNPESDSSSAVGDNEKKRAHRVYTWLFWSPLINLPVFFGALFGLPSDSSTINVPVLAALAPLVFHMPLLLGLTSKSIFVYRHTQQGILLVAARTSAVALIFGLEPYSDLGIVPVLLVNGSLWLFGSIWGWNQVRRGEYWWLKQKAEAAVTTPTRAPAPAGQIEALAPEKHIESSRELLNAFQKDDAKLHALAAFRGGERGIKLEAIRILETLDEVEEF